MDIDQEFVQLSSFRFEGRDLPVSFVETMEVTDGVKCDVYAFVGDPTKDLGVIRIKPGKRTPLQKVLKGERTIEGYLSGVGILKVTKPDGETITYTLQTGKFPVDVKIGETMQWEAAPDSELTAYEVCFPPYQDGRYENIE